jgi:hypothetical protein
VLPLWVPAELTSIHGAADDSVAEGTAAQDTTPVDQLVAAATDDRLAPAAAIPRSDAIEVDRVVPASGNLSVRGQQFWFGPVHAGTPVTLWIDTTTTVHLTLAGRHHKTLPSRLTTLDLARLRADGARTAGLPPARRSAAGLPAGATLELERIVNASGIVTLGGQSVSVGQPLAGRRVTMRLDEQLLHVITDGQLWKTIPCSLPPNVRPRLRGAHTPGPAPAPATAPVRVQRRVSSQGGIQVNNQRVQVGFAHRHTIVTVEIDETVLRLHDEHDKLIKTVPRTSREEVTRHKAYGRRRRAQA